MKHFKEALIVTNEKLTEEHINTVEQIKKILDNKSIEYYFVESKNFEEFNLKNFDLVIAIGGDGTFIRAASKIKNKPILGINSEPNASEGAILGIQNYEISKIEEILNGNYDIQKRDRACIKINGEEINELALNEVYIGTNHQFHTSRYELEYKNIKEEQRSSGVLVVTGTGSSAWYKSAGGKVFSYDSKILKFLVREPYKGRLFKTQIDKGTINENESLKIISKRTCGGLIAIDSSTTFDFNNGDIVEICMSKNPLNVLIEKTKENE